MTIQLVSPQQNADLKARVVRDSRSLDPESRLRTLFLQVDQPLAQTPPLLPGTFVRAEITGSEMDDLLCIPETAMTKQGLVWFVDNDNRLQCLKAQPVFYGEGVVYLRRPHMAGVPLSVAVSPNASYTGGLIVQPKTEVRG